jgi:hypothetical protein
MWTSPVDDAEVAALLRAIGHEPVLLAGTSNPVLGSGIAGRLG